MTYVLSDVHGDYARFRTMLKMVRFSEMDELNILGDVIDREQDSVSLLCDIMIRPNIHMLLGNHEAMLLVTFGPKNVIAARKQWMQNGGDGAYQQMVYGITAHKRRGIIHSLQVLPDHLQIMVNGQQFYLAHGNIGETREQSIWNSTDSCSQAPPIQSTTVIVGHTCTCYMRSQAENNQADHHTIFHGCGWIGIDCGCEHPWKAGRLACLRLEDMEELYIK